MSSKRIFLSPPSVDQRERELLLEAFDSNWIAPLGPCVDAFEKALAIQCHRKSCAALSSGTSAIHLALNLLGCDHEDVVLTQSFTFCGTVNPVVYCGSTPFFIDSEVGTWNMCPEALERAIKRLRKSGKHIKAIIPVHLYGMPANMDAIVHIAAVHEIPIIEDAAEALGATFSGQACGSFGHFSVLSFNGNKIITTSGGGALLSNDSDLIERARWLASQARDDAPHYEHSAIGYNYRLSNLSAAVGLGQLEALGHKVAKRRQIHQSYRNFFKNYPFVGFQEAPDPRYESNRWLTCITIDSEQMDQICPKEIMIALEEDHIETRPLWKPMHLQPVFRDCDFENTGVSQDLFQRGICLPSGSGMDLAAQERIFESLEKILR